VNAPWNSPRIVKASKVFAFVFFAIGALWIGWTHLLDFLDHVAKTIPGLDLGSSTVRSIVTSWLRSHVHWANDLGPWLFLAAGVAALFSPTLVPVAERVWERLRVAREIDSASGWSVSITLPRAITGGFGLARPQDNWLGFQGFRLVNISNSRQRVLDVEITVPSAGGGQNLLVWRSAEGRKTGYQKGLEAMPDREWPRMAHFINFPLKFPPSEMIDGQIVVPVPIESAPKEAAVLLPLWMDSNGVTFKFTEHVSGHEVTLKMGEDFDAHVGRTVAKSARRVRPKFMKLRLRDLWKKLVSAND
jgi:hypothetical protein